MSSSFQLAACLVDISSGLTSNILADTDKAASTKSEGNTASRELLNFKRKSREEEDNEKEVEEFIPLVRSSKRTKSAASNNHLYSSISGEGSVFSINDTSFHNANKNAKSGSKASRKKKEKGSNYADKLKTKVLAKQIAKKQLLKVK